MGGSRLRAPATVKAWSGEPLAPGTASAAAVVTRGSPLSSSSVRGMLHSVARWRGLYSNGG
jgi:hypothetical protein